jgi:hypothetical protein
MALIATATHTDTISGWSFNVTDLGVTGRNKENPSKLNPVRAFNSCQHAGCATVINRRRTSGLCDIHEIHQHDILLELHAPGGALVNAPGHVDIVDQLILWARTRNYDLVPLFSDFSFNILGNVPDVSTLAGEVLHGTYVPPSLQQLLDDAVAIVDRYFPDHNNGSYQPLHTNRGDIPARILAITFAALVVCEEANRGDRWFWRQMAKDETKTKFLGGAMPIGYFAARSFPWGIELGKAASLLVPKGV